MTYKVKLLPIVYTDLQKAKTWYQNKSNNLGDEFKTELNKEIHYIANFPEHYQRKYKELRHHL